jgi:hypothetical protein
MKAESLEWPPCQVMIGESMFDIACASNSILAFASMGVILCRPCVNMNHCQAVDSANDLQG